MITVHACREMPTAAVQSDNALKDAILYLVKAPPSKENKDRTKQKAVVSKTTTDLAKTGAVPKPTQPPVKANKGERIQGWVNTFISNPDSQAYPFVRLVMSFKAAALRSTRNHSPSSLFT